MTGERLVGLALVSSPLVALAVFETLAIGVVWMLTSFVAAGLIIAAVFTGVDLMMGDGR